MSPEVQAAFDQLKIAFVGLLIIGLTATGGLLKVWADERAKRIQAEGQRKKARDQVQQVTEQADADRESLLNDFTEDCLQRVNGLAGDLKTLRDDMNKQAQAHEQDRQRWIEERNARDARIEAMDAQLHALLDERAERETVIREQSQTIESLQTRVEQQGERINELERKNRELSAQVRDNE